MLIDVKNVRRRTPIKNKNIELTNGETVKQLESRISKLEYDMSLVIAMLNLLKTRKGHDEGRNQEIIGS